MAARGVSATATPHHAQHARGGDDDDDDDDADDGEDDEDSATVHVSGATTNVPTTKLPTTRKREK